LDKPVTKTDLLCLAGILALVIGGSGPFTVDRLVFHDRPAARDQLKKA
jgi:hypothetical protein